MENDKVMFIHVKPSADSEKIEELLSKSDFKAEELQYLTNNIKLFDTEEEYLQHVYLDTDELKKEITQHVSSLLTGFKVSRFIIGLLIGIESFGIFMILRFL